MSISAWSSSALASRWRESSWRETNAWPDAFDAPKRLTFDTMEPDAELGGRFTEMDNSWAFRTPRDPRR
jgi:hypothetical protein